MSSRQLALSDPTIPADDSVSEPAPEPKESTSVEPALSESCTPVAESRVTVAPFSRACSTVKRPLSCRPRTVRVALALTVVRRKYGPGGSEVPPAVPGLPVVLTSRSKAPVRETPSSASWTPPVSFATTPELVITSSPAALLRVRNGGPRALSPEPLSPSASSTLLATTLRPPVVFWKLRSPVRDWPISFSSRPMPEIATYGPLAEPCWLVPVNFTVTVAEPPGIVSVSSMSSSNVLTRT